MKNIPSYQAKFEQFISKYLNSKGLPSQSEKIKEVTKNEIMYLLMLKFIKKLSKSNIKIAPEDIRNLRQVSENKDPDLLVNLANKLFPSDQESQEFQANAYRESINEIMEQLIATSSFLSEEEKAELEQVREKMFDL